METVKVIHIGLGSFGRYGFEKLVELDQHYEEVDVELVGVCERDPEKLSDALKFADSQGVEVDAFEGIDEAYQRGIKEDSEDCKILIYDAGPSELHADHISRSLRNGFYHLAEKPPSMTREDHINQKKLMMESDVRFTVDFIERESPIIKKAKDIFKDKELDSLEVFRESTLGVQKLLDPVRRTGVKGGAVIDKMSHEAYIMDMTNPEKVSEVEKQYYMPYSIEGDSLMGIRGEKLPELSEKVAAGTCSARITGDTEIVLNASWLGTSQKSRTLGLELQDITGHNPVNTEFATVNGTGLRDEEARFFVARGERDLFGDMLNKRLFDLETGEEIETPSLMHDQLYRVIESSIREAAGLENNEMPEEEIDTYMNMIFDVSEHYEGDSFEEVEKANARVSELTHKNIFEAEASSENA